MTPGFTPKGREVNKGRKEGRKEGRITRTIVLHHQLMFNSNLVTAVQVQSAAAAAAAANLLAQVRRRTEDTGIDYAMRPLAFGAVDRPSGNALAAALAAAAVVVVAVMVVGH